LGIIRYSLTRKVRFLGGGYVSNDFSEKMAQEIDAYIKNTLVRTV